MARYVYLGNQRVAIVNKPSGQNPQLYLNFSDHLNSSSILTNSTGTITTLKDYYPFGEERVNVQNGSYSPIYQFTDKEFDSESDLNYFGSRYWGIKNFLFFKTVFISGKRKMFKN